MITGTDQEIAKLKADGHTFKYPCSTCAPAASRLCEYADLLARKRTIADLVKT